MLSKFGNGNGNTCPLHHLLFTTTSGICRFGGDSRLKFRVWCNFRCRVMACRRGFLPTIAYSHRFGQYKWLWFSGRSSRRDRFAGWHRGYPGWWFFWGDWFLFDRRRLLRLWLMVLLGLGTWYWPGVWYWLDRWLWLDSLGGKGTCISWFFHSLECWFGWWGSANRLAFNTLLYRFGRDFLILLLLFLSRHGRSMSNWFQLRWVYQIIVLVPTTFRGETVSRGWWPRR